MSAVEFAPPPESKTAPAPDAAPDAGDRDAKDVQAHDIAAGLTPSDNKAHLRHSIDLRQDRTALLMTALFVAVIAVLLAGLWLGHFAKTESARGIVSTTGGFSRLDAPRSGIIKEIYVKQGETVAVGTPIYLLRSGEAGMGDESAVAANVRTSTQTRANLLAEAERARAFAARIREQQAILSADQASLIAALDNQEKSILGALSQSREKVDRVRSLVKQGYATRELLDGNERTFFEYERQLTDVRLKRVEFRRLDTEKQRELATSLFEKENLQSSAESQINAIDGQISRLKTESGQLVRAQSAGQVLAVTAKVGDSVETGEFVAAVGDASTAPLIVLNAPSRAVGLAKVGQKVILKYDAFPFKSFGIHHGTVTAISTAAIAAPSTQGDAGLDPRPVAKQSLYRIEVQPDSYEIDAYGEKKRLRIGSTLSADIIIERRRLIDWVLDPIRAMRGRT